jgi:arylsulfatase A
VLIVVADDLGYGDLGCYGHPTIQTPHLDRFAAQGLRLTNCYAAHPNCSPSRAALLTGRTPFRIGIYNWIPMFSPMHLRQSEVTIARLLRDAGYTTCHVGKWHLNGAFNQATQPQPSDHGFDHWFSTQNNALPNHRNPNNFVRNGQEVGPLTGYSAQLVAEEFASWLKHDRAPEKPFFAFVCFHEPHEPIATAPEYSKLYPSDDPSFSAHHGNITQMDAGFGSLLQALEEAGVREETFVFFTSDNGPAITPMHPHGSAGPLRDKKGSIYEGGIRVPGIVQWPGHVQGGQTSDVPVCGVDLLPTLCEIASLKVPDDRVIDGTSFVPVLDGRELTRQRPLYWQFNRAKSDVKVALRDGPWKVVAGLTPPGPQSGGGIPEDEIARIKTAELADFALYQLEREVAETTDRSRENPAEFAELKSRMEQVYQEVRSAAPTWPTWEWPRYESQRIQWPDYWTNRRRQ